MATNAKFKLDGTQYDFEKDAEVVKYGSGTLKTALDNLKSVRMTGFGKQLLTADADDFRRLLQVGKNYFVDEAKSNDWRGFAAISSAQKKFGNYSLKVSNNGLSSSPIYFGGDPFTISFWAYLAKTSDDVWLFRTTGASNSFGLVYKFFYSYVVDLYAGTTSASQIYSFSSYNATANFSIGDSNSFTAAWHHFELTYDGSAIRYYRDGALKRTYTTKVAREGRRIIFGTAPAYIDSVRILDGVCGTGKKASKVYALSDYPNNTVALLNFV